jgi:RNA polymerase sigma-70 factor, ECF subfamily
MGRHGARWGPRTTGDGSRVKDFRDRDVESPDVETTDDPVITTGVAPGAVARSALTVSQIVEDAFDAHAPHLKAFAMAAVRDSDAADDLVQETFLRFVRHVRTQGVPDNIGGWLHRVCANLVISRGRRETVAGRKRSLLVDRSVGASPEDYVIRSDEGARLRDALGELPADARTALLMAASGFSSAEIGEAIGRTPNATSTYICRARMRLRELLSPPAESSR